MTDYYKDCEYCDADSRKEDHKEDCPLYVKDKKETANFQNLRKIGVGYD